jgi:hypothetical protein
MLQDSSWQLVRCLLGGVAAAAAACATMKVQGNALTLQSTKQQLVQS